MRLEFRVVEVTDREDEVDGQRIFMRAVTYDIYYEKHPEPIDRQQLRFSASDREDLPHVKTGKRFRLIPMVAI